MTQKESEKPILDSLTELQIERRFESERRPDSRTYRNEECPTCGQPLEACECEGEIEY